MKENKYGNIPVERFRSKLERYCYNLLTEEGLKFEYEPFEIILLDGFIYELPS